MTLDIIIPLYNKEKSILNYYNKINDELKNVKHKFIFVDDSSNDKTLDILKEIYSNDDENVKIISLSNNCGKDLSIKAGLEYSNSELVCVFDLDLQANVTHITKMYDFLIEHTNYDCVCMYSNYEENKFFKKLKIKLLNKLFKLNIDINKTNYKMFRKNIKNAILKYPSNFFSQYIFELVGFNIYYSKFDNKNHLKDIDTTKLISYSEKPYNFIKFINYFLIVIFFILLILRVTKVLKIGNSTCLFGLFLLIILQQFLTSFIICSLNVKNKKHDYYIRELIGFDDNIL